MYYKFYYKSRLFVCRKYKKKESDKAPKTAKYPKNQPRKREKKFIYIV